VYEGAASNSVVCMHNKMFNGHASALGIVRSVLVTGLFEHNSMSIENLFQHAGQLSQSVAGGAKLEWQVAKHVSSSFDGGTTDAHGEDGGANDPYTIFTVTGDVLVAAVWGVCNTSLVGAATLEVGVVGNTAKILAQITDATTLDDGDLYTDDGTEAGADYVVPAGGWIALNDGADIIETTGTTNITAGQIDYYCIWAPVEDGAKVTSAEAVA